jgi:hypothetical protein
MQRPFDLLGQDDGGHLPGDGTQGAHGGGDLLGRGPSREAGAGALHHEGDRLVHGLGQPAAQEVTQPGADLDLYSGLAQLEGEVEQRRAGHQPGVTVGPLHVTGRFQLCGQAPGGPAGELGELGVGHDPRPVVRPRRGERGVDAQPLGDGAARAVTRHEVADGVEGEAPLAQLGDEAESLDVLVVVHGVTTAARRLRQEPFRLVVADRARRQTALCHQLCQTELRHGRQSTTRGRQL